MIKTLWGLKTLITEGVDQTMRLVERTQLAAAENSRRHLEKVPKTERPIAAIEAGESVASGAFQVMRAVNAGVGHLTDIPFVLANASDRVPSTGGKMGAALDQVAGAVNGFVGDHLEARGNPAAFQMSVCHEGTPVELTGESLARVFPQATANVVVWIHGMATTEWSWDLFSERFHGTKGVNFGTQLQDDLGITPVFLRYNTGRHISANGQTLCELLGELLEHYPVPIERLSLVGHSMGGLVARSAAHYGQTHQAPWIAPLDKVICIGSPHLGAPLEKAAHVVSSILGAFHVPGTQIPAQILNVRSSGIKDLRYGYTVDEEWQDRDPDAVFDNNRHEVPFVEGVSYGFIAGHFTDAAGHPGAKAIGDLIVRVASASGVSKTTTLPFHHGTVLGRMNHFTIVNHPKVYEVLKTLFSGETQPEA